MIFLPILHSTTRHNGQGSFQKAYDRGQRCLRTRPHLIADEDHWRDESPFVKDAKALGTIAIVPFDWFEDSLCQQRAYSTKKYLWTTLDKKNGTKATRKKKEKKEESEEVKQFKKGAQAAKRDLQSGTSKEPSTDEEDHGDSAAGAASSGRGTGRGRGRGRGSAGGRGSGRGRGGGAGKARGNSNSATKAQPASILDDEENLPDNSKANPPQPSPSRSSSSPSPTPTRPLDSSVQKLAAYRAAAAATRADALSKKICSNLSSCASTDNYHVYVDNTGFPHNVTMTRVNVLANTSERIELSMYETDLEITKFYAVHVAYSGPNNAQEKKILVNPGAEFNDAFKKFRAAFKRVCLIPWEQRLIPEACNRSTFRDVEMHNRARKEMEKFGEIFTLKKPDGSWFDPQKMEDDEDEDPEVGPDGKRKRGDGGKKRKRRKKNSDDSDDEERGIKLLSPEDLKACKILPFRYVPPPKGKPRGALPEFNRVVGHDDMKDDEDFLTMPKL
ncbi:hypothetical protein IWZ01DRAFT_506328 [Phyllosticta capitalensis]